MRDIASKFLRYFLTGGCAALIDIGGFAALVAAGAPVAPAAALSFGIAAIFNYLLSARLAFRQAPTARHFALFLAVALLGMAVNVGVTVAVASTAIVPDIWAKVAGVGVAFLFNFMANYFFVFARPVS